MKVFLPGFINLSGELEICSSFYINFVLKLNKQ